MSDWNGYRRQLWTDRALGFALDTSRMRLPEDPLAGLGDAAQRALTEMEALEAGAIANADEKRRVGHYWLRDAARAPDAETRAAVEQTLARTLELARKVHAGEVSGEKGERFDRFVVVGIGGSALGPLFVARALGQGAADKMRPFFLDNTDPEGMDLVLASLGGHEALGRTLTVVISKSGGTKETRNGMLEFARFYKQAGLSFAKHAVAITGEGSELDKVAVSEGWLARLPMFDWIGGRTSELSAVGLFPAALQGLDVLAMLEGARAMDALTRGGDVWSNPSLRLAVAWFHAAEGKGKRAMVLLPYKDRLELASRYLQQLVMESLGKRFDRQGKEVHQGLAVYGNKGSTDQHAYVQQLREGPDDFFITFLEVLTERKGEAYEVEPGVTSGDYLAGFLEGTRTALYEAGRRSLTLTMERVDARSLGALLALYERAVGFYGTLVNVNAYHQPGVEAGKKAAAEVLSLQGKALAALRSLGGARTAEEVAKAAGSADVETVWKVLRRMAFNGNRGVRAAGGGAVGEERFEVA